MLNGICQNSARDKGTELKDISVHKYARKRKKKSELNKRKYKHQRALKQK